VSASSIRISGSQTLVARREGATDARRSRFVKATGYRLARRRAAIAKTASSGTTSSERRKRGDPKLNRDRVRKIAQRAKAVRRRESEHQEVAAGTHYDGEDEI
jgi:hypothetical protein